MVADSVSAGLIGLAIPAFVGIFASEMPIAVKIVLGLGTFCLMLRAVKCFGQG